MSDPQPASDPTQFGTPPSHDALGEIRVTIYILAAVLFLTSLSLNLFILKQNRRLQIDLDATRGQVAQIEANQSFQQNRAVLGNLLTEVKATGRPEADQILARYPIRIESPAPPPR